MIGDVFELTAFVADQDKRWLVDRWLLFVPRPGSTYPHLKTRTKRFGRFALLKSTICSVRFLGVEAIGREKPIRGDLNIRNEMCETMSRDSNIARIRPAMPLDTELLLPLINAFLSGMSANTFMLSGIEEVDRRLYTQSWYCRPG
ncbi:hypothetical protein DMW99_23270 [Pseudomonas chlororaphis]|nr:hypothetical protein C1Y36_19890 [Pseudomonas sp. FW306-2-2C-D06C]PYC33358.1 hypothetical protein DMW99_23270 [Pseudomonas chlororaphis]